MPLLKHFVALWLIWSMSPAVCQQTQDSTRAVQPEAVVDSLYRLVTFGPDNPPRWDLVRSLFAEEAVIVLRTSRDASTLFTVDGFIAEFQDFAKNEKVVASGFQERILKMKGTVYGDISHFFVLYEASVPGSEREPQQGVDSFQLIKTDSTWKILSITNEIVGPSNPLPEELFD